MQILINGALDRTLTDASQTSSLTASVSLELGGNAGENRNYDGILDEVRVWNLVRTAQILSDAPICP